LNERLPKQNVLKGTGLVPKLSALATLCGAAALMMVTGCSSNSITSPSALSGANATEFSSLGGSTHVGLNHYNDPSATGTGGNPAVSCPTEAPRIYHSGVLDLRIEFQWQPLYNVKRYQVEVERRTLAGWVQLDSETISDTTLFEIYGVEGGRYRLRVRSLVCGREGSWTDWTYESIEGREDLAVPSDPVIVIDGGDGGGPVGGPPTTTYWFTDKGNGNSRKNGCENPGQGLIGTYLGDLGEGGVCKLVTPYGTPVVPPQPFWDPYSGPLP
jgi:hypothetical protein